MSKEKDYTSKVLTTTALVVVMLLGMCFIPAFRVGKTVVKRANIFSDFISFHDSVLSGLSSRDILDTSFLADISPELDSMLAAASVEMTCEQVCDSIAVVRASIVETVADDEAKDMTVGVEDDIEQPQKVVRTVVEAEINVEDERAAAEDDSAVEIEDFSRDGEMMSRFYEALVSESQSRTVRIAVLGDSFIENDIITGDLREQLQDHFGGRGVGFVPFSHPLAKYRATVNHTFRGWKDYGILNKKNIPEVYRGDFFVSGIISVPENDAAAVESHYLTTTYRKHISRASHADIFFRNQGATEMYVTVNDTVEYRYALESSDKVQRIRVNADIAKMDISLPERGRFVGYGVAFEDATGVSVHNFSVRSNSGLALFSTDRNVNLQMNEFMNYDLIIVQYGLNAMSAEVTDYSYYGSQLKRLLDYVKLCFPQSAVMVMSVGDRCSKRDNNVVTMSAVEPMIAAQRKAAEDAGVAFWNTFDAMGGRNSMVYYVSQGWAGKDYTHINIKGGKQIATRMVGSLLDISRSGKVEKTVFSAVLEQ